MDKTELIEELKQRLGAIPEEEFPSKEDLAVLEERAKVEEAYSYSFSAFVEYFQLIKCYALDEKLLEKLAWKIEDLMEPDDISSLKNTAFFKEFGEHRIIREAIIEHELKREVQ